MQGTLAFAPPIEILYRPRPDIDAALWEVGARDWYSATPQQKKHVDAMIDRNSLGHVAIRLPEGAIPGGRIYGFQPLPVPGKSFIQVMDHLLFGGDGFTFPSTPGAFEVDDSWAKEGIGNRFDATRSMRMEVSEEKLQAIVSAIKRMNSDPKVQYQLIPNVNGSDYRYPKDKFNCVAAVNQVLQEAGISLDIFPENGSITEMSRRAKPVSTLYFEGCLFRIVD